MFKRIESGGPFTERSAALVIATILNALMYIHEHGIVHRDVKPANLLMSDDSENASLVLVDFGSSFSGKSSKAYGTDGKEAMKTIAGTPFYLAPEIVKGQTYNEKVDIWSVGCIAYQLLCGQTPFQAARGFQELYSRIQRAEFSFPTDLPISDLAKDFIKSLLIVDPAHRPTALQAMGHPWFREHIPNCYWLLMKLHNHEADPTRFEAPTETDLANHGCHLSLQGCNHMHPEEIAPLRRPSVAKPLRQNWESHGKPGVLQMSDASPQSFYTDFATSRPEAHSWPGAADEEGDEEALIDRLTNQSGFIWPGAFSQLENALNGKRTPTVPVLEVGVHGNTDCDEPDSAGSTVGSDSPAGSWLPLPAVSPQVGTGRSSAGSVTVVEGSSGGRGLASEMFTRAVSPNVPTGQLFAAHEAKQASDSPLSGDPTTNEPAGSVPPRRRTSEVRRLVTRLASFGMGQTAS